MLKKLLLIVLIAVSSAYGAHQLEVNVNDREVEGGISIDTGRLGSFSHTYLGAKFLNADINNSTIPTDANITGTIDTITEVSALAEGYVTSVKGLKLGIGAKLVKTKLGNLGFMALPIGFEGQLRLPIQSTIPIFVGGELYYAPSFLSFDKAKAYMESRIYIDAEMMQNLHGTIGYREIDTDYTTAKVVYNEAWYFGLRLDF